MNIFAKRTNALTDTPYATSADFCRIFADDMDRLYCLSLLLTADYELAERCFVRALEDSKNGNPVFKEWAQSWARRTIISNAIRVIGPRDGKESDPPAQSIASLPVELTAVIELKPFERFVFVMSVLEGYSDRDCRILLDCSASDVAQARARGLQQLGVLAQRRGKAEKTGQVISNAQDREFTLASGLTQRLALSA